MITDRPLSNGPACISAEWIHEMIAMEIEVYAPNELLSIVSFMPAPPISANPSPSIAKVDPCPDEARLLAGSAKASLVTCG